MNFKGLAIIIVLVAVVAAGAYTLGTKQAPAPSAPVAQAPQPQPSTPPHPVVQPQSAPQPAPSSSAKQVQLMPEGHPAAAPAGGFTHFRVGNRNVKSMLSDGDLMWVGTSGGVIRYDVKADKYDLFNVDSGSLLANGVFHVSKLGDRIMVGTYGGGLSIYDPEWDEWTNYNIPHGLADQFVYDVLEMDNGDVWIATWSGANRVKGGNFDDPAAWETFTVANTSGGLPNDWVYGLDRGEDGAVWLGTEGGLALYKDGTWTNWNHEKGLGASIDVVKDDIAFTNDPGKASKHHARQKVEQGLQDVNIAYNPNYIISLAVDKDGVVWCGTWGGGLGRFDGKSWRNFTVADGLPANHIFMLSVDDSGVLWVGTNRGMARYNGEGRGFSVRTTANGLYSDNVFSMDRAADGSTWIGSFGGVARIENFQ